MVPHELNHGLPINLPKRNLPNCIVEWVPRPGETRGSRGASKRRDSSPIGTYLNPLQLRGQCFIEGWIIGRVGLQKRGYRLVAHHTDVIRLSLFHRFNSSLPYELIVQYLQTPGVITFPEAPICFSDFCIHCVSTPSSNSERFNDNTQKLARFARFSSFSQRCTPKQFVF